MLGSSPLTRGKPGDRARDARPEGLIPAHAGKTIASTASNGMQRAHPRSRGENPRRPGACRPAVGSSPLTRGKQTRRVDADRFLGLIPAHAGKTLRRARTMFWSWAHPRSRGENTWLHKDTGLPSGSSPLTRGKRGHPPTRRLRVGLIPAHAGKTCELGVHQRHRRAHPRSRGENAAGIASVALTQGSSPLTRGKRTNSPPFKRAGRLIPAHAGKTRHHQRPSPHRRAHPRSRGENDDTARIS